MFYLNTAIAAMLLAVVSFATALFVPAAGEAGITITVAFVVVSYAFVRLDEWAQRQARIRKRLRDL